jgi:hypothetical protein
MKRIRKAIVVVLLATFALGMATVIWLDSWYYSHLPRMPDTKVGRTNEITVSHGSVRYATQLEVRWLRSAKIGFLLALGCGIAAGLTNAVYRDFRPPTTLATDRNGAST